MTLASSRRTITSFEVDEACCACQAPVSSTRCEQCGCAQRAGPFRVVTVLSQSLRGRVYLATAPNGRRVALKELVFATVPSVEQIDAFMREAAILRQLEHPQIPRFIDSFQEGPGVHTRLYLAQEHVEGIPLSRRLAEHRYSEPEAEAIARQVLEILIYLHGLSPRVLHRDIKPANLIERSDGRVALVDFGAARDLAADQTHNATLVGTFGYMPLEQLGGTVSESSDLYALGATLIHLLSRRAPDELLNAQHELEFSRSIHVAPQFSEFLKRLVAVDPSSRFKTAAEALAALDRPQLEVVPSGPAPPENSALGFALWEVEHRVRQTYRTTSRAGALFGAVMTPLVYNLPPLTWGHAPIVPWLLCAALTVTGFKVGGLLSILRAFRSLPAWVDELSAVPGVSRHALMEGGTAIVERIGLDKKALRRRSDLV